MKQHTLGLVKNFLPALPTEKLGEGIGQSRPARQPELPAFDR